MLDGIRTTLSESVAAVTLGVVGIAFGIQRLVKQWKTTSAESSIMDLMHTELERLANQNKLLTSELNKLQLELIALNKELSNLSLENNRLHFQVVNLNAEVNRLQNILTLHNFKDHNDDSTR